MQVRKGLFLVNVKVLVLSTALQNTRLSTLPHRSYAYFNSTVSTEHYTLPDYRPTGYEVMVSSLIVRGGGALPGADTGFSEGGGGCDGYKGGGGG